MTTYFIRTTDPETLLALAVKIGVLREHEGTHVMANPHQGVWDVVGPIHRPTGNVISTEFGDMPEMAPIADAEGKPYWHANLMLYTQTLGDMIRAPRLVHEKILADYVPPSRESIESDEGPMSDDEWAETEASQASYVESLREQIAAAAAEEAGLLASVKDYFVTGEDGQTVAPTQPARVFL